MTSAPATVTEWILKGSSSSELYFNRREAGRRTILKASMVVPGKDCPDQASVEEVAAESTLMCLESAVPAILPGIVSCPAARATRPRPRTWTR